MDFVANLSLFVALKNFTNRLRIEKVIAMDRLAQFFSDSQCIEVCTDMETPLTQQAYTNM